MTGMNRCRLYSDFNCPFCYAMHERLHALGVMQQISWQGVQHAPHLPEPMAVWAGQLRAELKQEVEMVRRLAPEVSISLPAGKPNTALAIAAAARALRLDLPRAGDFIRSLYRLFWIEGADLSDRQIVQAEAERFGFAGTELAGSAAPPIGRVLDEWRDRWEQTDHHGVPLLQRPDQQMLVGLVPQETLRRTHSLRTKPDHPRQAYRTASSGAPSGAQKLPIQFVLHAHRDMTGP